MTAIYRFPFKAMGSPCLLCFYSHSKQKAEQLKEQVIERVETLENRYSRYRPDSLVSQINASAGTLKKIQIDSETVALLGYAEQCYAESNGLFDITSGVLRQAWNFSQSQTERSSTTLPDKAQLSHLLSLIDWQQVIWGEDWIYLAQPEMELDFGGIVKEYAADSLAQICLEHDIDSGFINMGGDIHIFGSTPDKQGWPIAIQHPHESQQAMTKFHLKKGGLASSGDYERFIEIAGKRYSHILDPQTGWPVSGLSAVSVVAEHCVVAGSMATIAMLKGEQGLDWLKYSGVNFICCTDKGEIHTNLA